jgi:hypothetical protein
VMGRLLVHRRLLCLPGPKNFHASISAIEPAIQVRLKGFLGLALLFPGFFSWSHVLRPGFQFYALTRQVLRKRSL